jgi:hypothetical protein
MYIYYVHKLYSVQVQRGTGRQVQVTVGESGCMGYLWCQTIVKEWKKGQETLLRVMRRWQWPWARQCNVFEWCRVALPS